MNDTSDDALDRDASLQARAVPASHEAAHSDGVDEQKQAKGSEAKWAPYLENVSESTVACLITMVQGNLLALGLSHWIIASQTGILAGAITATALLWSRIRKRWLVSLLLGTVTAVVDYFIHPGMFGPAVAEAIVTGIGAAALSYAVGTFLKSRRG